MLTSSPYLYYKKAQAIAQKLNPQKITELLCLVFNPKPLRPQLQKYHQLDLLQIVQKIVQIIKIDYRIFQEEKELVYFCQNCTSQMLSHFDLDQDTQSQTHEEVAIKGQEPPPNLNHLGFGKEVVVLCDMDQVELLVDYLSTRPRDHLFQKITILSIYRPYNMDAKTTFDQFLHHGDPKPEEPVKIQFLDGRITLKKIMYTSQRFNMRGWIQDSINFLITEVKNLQTQLRKRNSSKLQTQQQNWLESKKGDTFLPLNLTNIHQIRQRLLNLQFIANLDFTNEGLDKDDDEVGDAMRDYEEISSAIQGEYKHESNNISQSDVDSIEDNDIGSRSMMDILLFTEHWDEVTKEDALNKIQEMTSKRDKVLNLINKTLSLTKEIQTLIYFRYPIYKAVELVRNPPEHLVKQTQLRPTRLQQNYICKISIPSFPKVSDSWVTNTQILVGSVYVEDIDDHESKYSDGIKSYVLLVRMENLCGGNYRTFFLEKNERAFYPKGEAVGYTIFLPGNYFDLEDDWQIRTDNVIEAKIFNPQKDKNSTIFSLNCWLCKNTAEEFNSQGELAYRLGKYSTAKSIYERHLETVCGERSLNRYRAKFIYDEEDLNTVPVQKHKLWTGNSFPEDKRVLLLYLLRELSTISLKMHDQDAAIYYSELYQSFSSCKNMRKVVGDYLPDGFEFEQFDIFLKTDNIAGCIKILSYYLNKILAENDSNPILYNQIIKGKEIRVASIVKAENLASFLNIFNYFLLWSETQLKACRQQNRSLATVQQLLKKCERYLEQADNYLKNIHPNILDEVQQEQKNTVSQLLIKTYELTADTYDNVGESNSALSYLIKSITDLGKISQDLSRRLQINTKMTQILLREEKYVEAIRELQQCKPLAEWHENPQLFELQCLNRIGCCYKNLDMLQKSRFQMDLLFSKLKNLKTVDNSELQVKFMRENCQGLLIFGEIMEQYREFEISLHYYEECRKICKYYRYKSMSSMEDIHQTVEEKIENFFHRNILQMRVYAPWTPIDEFVC